MSEKSIPDDNKVITTDEKPTNPLIQRARIPGETFTLPSQGIFYTKGELDSEATNGEVYIYPMVTFDEIILKTPDKLFSGEAIVDVFSRCVPSIKKPLDLLAKDVDFVMVCLRKLTYGDNMEILFSHNCENAKEQKYNISVNPFISLSKKIDATNADDIYKLTLDNGQVVRLSPPKFKHVIKIYQATVDDGLPDDIASLNNDLLDTIVGMISSVDDITDENLIKEWVETIPAGWVRAISDSVEKLSDWGPDFITKVKCKDCGKEMEIATPINPLAFFI